MPKIKRSKNGHYPGKPGPAPTGLKRKIMLPFMVDDSEFEYLKRMSKFVGVSVAEFMRGRVFPMTPDRFKENLRKLRETQGGNIP